METVLNDVTKGANLKHVEVNDKAAPMIENITLKENPFKKVTSELEQGRELKHVDQVNDKSAPYIEKDVQIKANGRDQLLSEIQKRKTETEE